MSLSRSSTTIKLLPQPVYKRYSAEQKASKSFLMTDAKNDKVYKTMPEAPSSAYKYVLFVQRPDEPTGAIRYAPVKLARAAFASMTQKESLAADEAEKKIELAEKNMERSNRFKSIDVGKIKNNAKASGDEEENFDFKEKRYVNVKEKFGGFGAGDAEIDFNQVFHDDEEVVITEEAPEVIIL
jgi:hypothetical protein